jgi:hypothetical protein
MILSIERKYIMTLTVAQIESTYPVPAHGTNMPYHPVRAYHVPIELRDEVLAAYAAAGIKPRLRYRGPRAQSVGRAMPRLDGTTYPRNRYQAQSYCLLADATSFTVYDYTGA